jgi:hypothetical protein
LRQIGKGKNLHQNESLHRNAVFGGFFVTSQFERPVRPGKHGYNLILFSKKSLEKLFQKLLNIENGDFIWNLPRFYDIYRSMCFQVTYFTKRNENLTRTIQNGLSVYSDKCPSALMSLKKS